MTRTAAPDGGTWEDWLQTHRVELNAMTTPHSSRGSTARWRRMQTDVRQARPAR